jgi:hypothetical protein
LLRKKSIFEEGGIMASLELVKCLAVLSGILLIGEALVLLVGMVFLSPRPNPWVTFQNVSILILDLFFGAGLILFSLFYRTAARDPILLLITMITLVIHGFREWEYFARSNQANRFLINLPLFVLNNVKLLGLLLVGGLALNGLVG